MKPDDETTRADTEPAPETTTTVYEQTRKSELETTVAYSDVQRAQLGIAEMQEAEIHEAPPVHLHLMQHGQTGARGERGHRGHQGPRGKSRSLPLIIAVAGLSVALGLLAGQCSWWPQ